jgi:hypothetical protein
VSILFSGIGLCACIYSKDQSNDITTFVKKKPFSSSHLANASAMQATSPSILLCNDSLEATSVSDTL